MRVQPNRFFHVVLLHRPKTTSAAPPSQRFGCTTPTASRSYAPHLGAIVVEGVLRRSVLNESQAAHSFPEVSNWYCYSSSDRASSISPRARSPPVVGDGCIHHDGVNSSCGFPKDKHAATLESTRILEALRVLRDSVTFVARVRETDLGRLPGRIGYLSH